VRKEATGKKKMRLSVNLADVDSFDNVGPGSHAALPPSSPDGEGGKQARTPRSSVEAVKYEARAVYNLSSVHHSLKACLVGCFNLVVSTLEAMK
jgi:hypothetical protein